MEKIPTGNIFGIFKFGESEHIDAFVNRGHVYMNTLKYFREREESDLLRSDKHDGSSHCVQVSGAKLRMKQKDDWIDVGTLTGQMITSDGQEEDINVFCLYALRESSIDDLIDERNLRFGDTYAIFKNDGALEFLKRLKMSASILGFTVDHSLVTYVDRSTYNGPMGVFRKFSDFSYQSEFRISIMSKTKKPLELEIGDLSDIASTGNLSQVNEHIKIE